MHNIRIIPRLDIKGPNLVKGIHLEGLRVLGKPEEFSEYYYQNSADELIFMDVVASLYERNSLHDIISRVAKNVFIPLTVGGGIRTIEHISKVLRAGADKVSINTAAVRNPSFIKEAVSTFGSSTIVGCIETSKLSNGSYTSLTDNGREETGIEAISWAIQLAELGVGELLITSIDKEGTGKSFDIELIQKISSKVNLPIISHGGAGSVNDIEKLCSQTKTSAVALSSILHYHAINEISNAAHNKDEGNVEYLMKKRKFSYLEPTTITEIKKNLSNNNHLMRIDHEAEKSLHH